MMCRLDTGHFVERWIGLTRRMEVVVDSKKCDVVGHVPLRGSRRPQGRHLVAALTAGTTVNGTAKHLRSLFYTLLRQQKTRSRRKMRATFDSTRGETAKEGPLGRLDSG